MRRRTFDILMTAAGLFLAGVLIASGVLLTWAHTFRPAAQPSHNRS